MDYYEGGFPRWMALSKAFNNQDRSKHTSAYAILGDTKLERDIGVADGFPNMILGRGELIVIKDLLNVLGL